MKRSIWKYLCILCARYLRQYYLIFSANIPANFKISRKWELALPAAECKNKDYMNLGYQLTVRHCAAICDMKRGIAFTYGVQGKGNCKGSCSCRCWYLCISTSENRNYHLYKFKGMCNWRIYFKLNHSTRVIIISNLEYTLWLIWH